MNVHRPPSRAQTWRRTSAGTCRAFALARWRHPGPQHSLVQALARTIRGGSEQRELFEAAIEVDAPPAPVRLQEIRLWRGGSFGDVWLGWTLWRAPRRAT
jgi:hypothetical protein